MKILLRAGAMALALSACAAGAAPATQIPALNPNGQTIPSQLISETFVVASANVSAGIVTVIGGDYILDQVCAGYGTLKLQRLGPDGTTWIDSVSKAAADTTTGTGVTYGNGAQVRVTLTGTTGCNATLSRVP